MVIFVDMIVEKEGKSIRGAIRFLAEYRGTIEIIIFWKSFMVY